MAQHEFLRRRCFVALIADVPQIFGYYRVKKGHLSDNLSKQLPTLAVEHGLSYVALNVICSASRRSIVRLTQALIRNFKASYV
jgi:hypothetical protein